MGTAETAVPLHRRLVAAATWRGAFVAAALPVIFLHVDFQPSVHLSLGSTQLGIELSDLAVIAVGAAALAEGFRLGFAPLRAALPAWIAAVALLAWIGVRALTPFHLAHVVSAAKFAEYALLALVPPLLLRRQQDRDLVAAALIAWSLAATCAGLLQFFGVSMLEAWAAGRRQPSFLGHLDFAGLSGMVLLLALASLAFGSPLRTRSRIVVALVSGAVGLVLAGASAGALGVFAGAVVLASLAYRAHTLSWRAAIAGGAVVAVAVLGVLAVRGRDFDQFLRFVGVKREEQVTQTNVQTYVHHTLLAYIGWRIFLDHPVAGVGWQGADEPENYEPVLPAAHREFPDVAPISFPAPGREYGVQNAYVEILADLGVIGLLLWFAFYLTALVVALRGPPIGGAVAASWIVLAMALWIPQNLVAGLPLDALVWLALGTAALAASVQRHA